MNISIIGTGHVATTLAASWSKAGHAITLGSRDPQSKAGQFEYPVASLADAVAASDVIVNATPGGQSVEIFTSIGADTFAGKTVIDVANAASPSFDLIYPDSSLGQVLQDALPAAKVVKTLNTAAMTVLVDPSSLSGESSVFVSGDDDGAKDTVRGLLGDLGWASDSIVDLGGIASARGAEYYFVLFFALVQAGGPQFNIKVVR
ncbi:oxidoreductase [Subtercola lobariae]|uniref:Oxidoreductase n=2 Tax=Subtercola lobariae TaxID=1588641 RepID=A0A917B1J7_9MICO|nr:NAD(P)-binding domain-containing protein [Subtercola lobariae]GGF14776.1 oxidoreductase [Subtercola lobariae]